MSEKENKRTNSDANIDEWALQWRLFDQIINTTVEQQAEVLAGIEIQHPTHYPVLLELLASHQTASTVLDEPLVDIDVIRPDTIPENIGGYQIIKPLGAGGLGDVYQAKKEDDGFEHIVAIKMAPTGRYSNLVLDSFNNELRMLLNLNHPNIERLFEGGVSADNIPYLVVEYIDGSHIDEYCDQQRLSLKQRIKLFTQVCEAVATLHQSLIIHRDIKPSNIMVDHHGTAKLLDFGLAKLLDKNDDATEVTVSGYMMTLAYASPEQITGNNITTASDVYALGMLLSYLLCGQLPYHITNNDLAAASQQITEKTPPQASQNIMADSVISQRNHQLKSQLQGELDAILSKAIHKEPERRYASAQQLADDLKRFLRHEPVLARTDTVIYRMRKFIQRHTIGVVSSSLFVVSLLVLALMLFNRSQALQKSLLATQQEQRRVTAVTDFLVDVFKISDPLLNQSEVVNVKELLDHSTEQLHGQFNQEPATKARLYETLGSVYLNMSDITQAEQLIQRAAAIGVDRQPQEQLSAIMIEAELLLRKGELNPALNLLETFKAQNPDINYSPTTQLKLGLLTGTLQYQIGQYKQAIKTLSQAAQTVDDNEHVNSQFKTQQLRADINHLLGNVFWKLGDFFQVAKHYEKGYNSNLARLGADHHFTLKSLSALGVLAYAQGDFKLAQNQLEQVLQSRQQHLGDNHFLTADAHNRLGATFYELGHLDDAVTHYDAALKAFDASGLNDSIKYTRVLNNLGLVKRLQHQAVEAETLFSEALRIQSQLLGADHPDLGTMMHNLGLTAYDQFQYEVALDWFMQSYEIQYQANQLNNVNIAFSMTNIARMYTFLGQIDSAKKWIQESLSLRHAQLGEDNLLYAVTLMVQAEWALFSGDDVSAKQAAQAALKIRSEQLPDDDVRLVFSRFFVNSLAVQDANHKQSLACDLLFLENEFGHNHPTVMTLRKRFTNTAVDCQ